MGVRVKIIKEFCLYKSFGSSFFDGLGFGVIYFLLWLLGLGGFVFGCFVRGNGNIVGYR